MKLRTKDRKATNSGTAIIREIYKITCLLLTYINITALSSRDKEKNIIIHLERVKNSKKRKDRFYLYDQNYSEKEFERG